MRRRIPGGLTRFVRRAAVVIGVAGIILLVASYGAGRFLFRRVPTGPNVIMISLDTLRADHLSSYGHPNPTSPALDALAGESVLFENAYSQAPWTLPSHTSLLTSRYPTVNQAVKSGGLVGGKLPKWRVICPEIFREAGYRTSGIADGMFLTNRYGLEQGYDDFVGWGRRARCSAPGPGR